MSEPVDLFDAVGATELPGETVGGQWLTRIASVFDTTILQAARLAIDSTLMPHAEDLSGMFESAAPFLSGELVAHPKRYLELAGSGSVVLAETHRRRRSLRGGAVLSRRLSVPYTPYLESPEALAADAVRVEHWQHRGDWPRPTVLALHGFGMGYPSIDGPALFAAELYRHGFDVALMTLPYHGGRKLPGSRFSGQSFTSVDVGQLNEAMRRAVFEVLAVAEWLRERRGDPVGLMGLSLGGYLTSLAAGLAPQLDFAVAMVPPVCIGDLAWRFFERSRHHAGATRDGLRQRLRTAYRVHSPLTFPAAVDRKRLLIVAGRGDRIVPPEHPYALWQHWGRPDIHWFSGSHLAPFRRAELVARVISHVDACCR